MNEPVFWQRCSPALAVAHHADSIHRTYCWLVSNQNTPQDHACIEGSFVEQDDVVRMQTPMRHCRWTHRIDLHQWAYSILPTTKKKTAHHFQLVYKREGSGWAIVFRGVASNKIKVRVSLTVCAMAIRRFRTAVGCRRTTARQRR